MIVGSFHQAGICVLLLAVACFVVINGSGGCGGGIISLYRYG